MEGDILVFQTFKFKWKFLHGIKISVIMEIAGSLNFSYFADKFKISGNFSEVFDVFISVVNTKPLFKLLTFCTDFCWLRNNFADFSIFLPKVAVYNKPRCTGYLQSIVFINKQYFCFLHYYHFTRFFIICKFTLFSFIFSLYI